MPNRSSINDEPKNVTPKKDSSASELGRKGGIKGGRARAESLSAEERTAIAREAALTRWSMQSPKSGSAQRLPQATHMGVLKIGDAEIPCAVLEGGQRVLTQRSFLRALGRDIGVKSKKYLLPDAVNLPPFLTARNLRPFISGNIRTSSTPIKFKLPTDGRHQTEALGYHAELLPEVCRVFVDAKNAGELNKRQDVVAEKCDVLLAALATVGIVALVDEATGYQAERDRNELQKILAAYINPELLPWERRFPDDFYKEIFRLHGWTYSPPQLKRPSYVGKLTNELIYKQLPKGVYEDLRRKNPPNAKGVRKHRLHQFLTDDIGNPHLEKQLVAVMTLQRASKNNAEFKRLFNTVFPPRGKNQLEFHFDPDLDDDDESNS